LKKPLNARCYNFVKTGDAHGIPLSILYQNYHKAKTAKLLIHNKPAVNDTIGATRLELEYRPFVVCSNLS